MELKPPFIFDGLFSQNFLSQFGNFVKVARLQKIPQTALYRRHIYPGCFGLVDFPGFTKTLTSPIRTEYARIMTLQTGKEVRVLLCVLTATHD